MGYRTCSAQPVDLRATHWTEAIRTAFSADRPYPHHTPYPRRLNLSAHRFSAAIASALVS